MELEPATHADNGRLRVYNRAPLIQRVTDTGGNRSPLVILLLLVI